ncbi:MAG: hypothetical protein U0169_15475 [Polyangiaceae bacterium]
MVLCGLGADIVVAAATEDAVIVVARGATGYSVSRVVLATGQATTLAQWSRHPVYDA